VVDFERSKGIRAGRQTVQSQDCRNINLNKGVITGARLFFSIPFDTADVSSDPMD
jgi:hypothetical protein